MPGKLIVDEIEDSGGTSVIGRKNYIINGNFDIWQRGTSGFTTGYSADRYRNTVNGGTISISQGTFTVGQSDVPNNPKFYYNYDRTVANTSETRPIEQRIEGVRSLSNQTINVSFWAKYTTTSPTDLKVVFRQFFGSGGSASSSVVTVAQSGITITSSWAQYSYNVAIPSISGKTLDGDDDFIEFYIANDNLETFDLQIAQVQVEKGSVATDFQIRPIGEELNLCARYYQKLISPRVNFNFDNAGLATTTSLISVNIPLINEMRIDSDGTTGTVTKSGDMAINDFASNGNNLSGTPINYFRVSKTQLQLGLNKSSANLSSGSHYELSAADNAFFDIDVDF